jgi:DDE superfamily endonuclease
MCRSSSNQVRAYQFDWSREIMLIDGTTVKVKVAHILCHSRMIFERGYRARYRRGCPMPMTEPSPSSKGACRRGIYDNMKRAVETIFVRKDPIYGRRFLQMCSHYLVDPVACTPVSGWEKGQVENQLGGVRERCRGLRGTQVRLNRAGVPVEHRAARTKPEIALAEIDRVITAGVRFGCVLADAGYGLSAPFRQGLTARGIVWAVGFPGRQKVYPAEVKLIFPIDGRARPRQRHIPDPLSMPAEDMLAGVKWKNVSWRLGTKGSRRHALPPFACGSPTDLRNGSRTRGNSIFPARRRG